MILSSGERAVWAAVFAVELRALKEEGYENGPTGKDADDEYNICVRGAVESGYEAVVEMRKVAIELRDRLDGIPAEEQREDDCGELLMLHAMLGEE